MTPWSSERGPNGLAAAIELARAGKSVVVLRGRGHSRGRLSLGRADAAGLHPRHVLCDPASCAGITVLQVDAAGGSRREVSPPISTPRPSSRRRGRGRAGALGGETAEGLGADAGCLQQAHGSAGEQHRQVAARHLGPAGCPTIRCARSLRPLRGPLRLSGSRVRFTKRTRPRRCSPESPRTRCCRCGARRPRPTDHARARGARSRLADHRGRCAEADGRTGRPISLARR